LQSGTTHRGCCHTQTGDLIMKNKALNATLVLTVLVLLGVCAFYVRVGATADAVVVLKTSGMTCGSCAAKVTKALQGERGVAATEVDLEGGLVIAGYDSKQVAPEKLAQRVVAAGFASSVQSVLTPEQFKKIVGRNIGVAASGAGCCGAKECGGK
jgi:copper chaperone CopZ